MSEPELPPREIIEVPAFSLPPRGRYEANATIFQKRKLEQFADTSDHDLPERFYEMIDTLGRDQANYIIYYCELKELAKLQTNRLAAQDLATQRTSTEREQRHGLGCIAQVTIFIVGSVVAIWCAVRFSGTADTQFSSTVTPSIQSVAPLSVAPSIAPPPPKPVSQAFKIDVAYSQRAAVQKYPLLGTAGSPLNRAFLARLNKWKAGHDPRMDRSDWPERLGPVNTSAGHRR